MLHQVVSSVFHLMEEYEDVWKNIEGSTEIPTFGFVYAVGLEPINVNLDGMLDKFRLAMKELVPLYESILPEELMWFLTSLTQSSKEKFRFPDNVWAEIIYNFAIACHRKIMNEEHIIKSLTPLYLGKVASFVIETWDSSAEEVEERLEDLCLTFEREKPYLIERWFEEYEV